MDPRHGNDEHYDENLNGYHGSTTSGVNLLSRQTVASHSGQKLNGDIFKAAGVTGLETSSSTRVHNSQEGGQTK